MPHLSSDDRSVLWMALRGCAVALSSVTSQLTGRMNWQSCPSGQQMTDRSPFKTRQAVLAGQQKFDGRLGTSPSPPLLLLLQDVRLESPPHLSLLLFWRVQRSSRCACAAASRLRGAVRPRSERHIKGITSCFRIFVFGIS